MKNIFIITILIIITLLVGILLIPTDNNVTISNKSVTSPCRTKLTDEEYLKHMIPHHEVAVHMSKQLKTQNPIILKIVRNIIRIQLYEIAMMRDYMITGSVYDDMSDENIRMNTKYYPTQGDFAIPNTLEISDTFCDPSFFHITHELHDMTDESYMKHMIPHHQVAVDMSKKILETTKNDFIIYMAYRIIRAQQPEITELTNLLSSTYMYKSSIL